jgi:anti-sigma regulatory factor (Ser/Thr protein kinase)
MTQAEHMVVDAEHLGSGPPARLRIGPRAEEVSRARRWFRARLGGWPDEASAAAESVFGELAANAVRHGRGPVMVTVQLGCGAVRCDVRDGSWRAPRCQRAWPAEREGGRGMVIVAALADDWGMRRHLLGKTIWFEIRARA